MLNGDESRFQEVINFFVEDCKEDFEKLQKLITKRVKNLNQNKLEYFDREIVNHRKSIDDLYDNIYLIRYFIKIFFKENTEMSETFSEHVLDDIEENDESLSYDRILHRKCFLAAVCAGKSSDALLYINRVKRMDQSLDEELQHSLSQITILNPEKDKYVFADGSYILKLENGNYLAFLEYSDDDGY